MIYSKQVIAASNTKNSVVPAVKKLSLIWRHVAISAIMGLALLSCATPIYKNGSTTISTNQGGLLKSLKAEERVVITSTDLNRPVICAEPSPDAISAFAAQLALDADVADDIKPGIAASLTESTAFVGLRTQSIQLLRDAMYRLCEGYINGALGEDAYEVLMRRYQKFMVALLAIEQLTGTQRSPAVAITTEAIAGTSTISAIQDQLNSTIENIAKLEQDPTGDANDKEIERQITELRKDEEALQQGLTNARGNIARGSAEVVIISDGVGTNRADGGVQPEITAAVKDIVDKILDTSEFEEKCLELVEGGGGSSKDDKQIDAKAKQKIELLKLCERLASRADPSSEQESENNTMRKP